MKDAIFIPFIVNNDTTWIKAEIIMIAICNASDKSLLLLNNK